MSKADFREFCEAANFSKAYIDGNQEGLVMVDLDNFILFELLKENYSNSSIAYASSVLDTFENYLNDPAGIRACIGGKNLSALIQKDGVGNVPLNGGTNHFNWNGVPTSEGYVIISPANINGGSTKILYHDGSELTGLIAGARILHGLGAGDICEANFNHELLHWLFYHRGEIPVKFQYVSRGYDGGTMKKPGLADIKFGKDIAYNGAFKPRETSRNVLGLVSGVNNE